MRWEPLWALARLDQERDDPTIVAAGRFTLVALLVSTIAVVLFTTASAIFREGGAHMYVVATGYLTTCCVTFGLLRAGYVRAATHVLILMNVCTAVVFLWTEGPESKHIGIFFIAIITAGWLARPKAALFYGLVAGGLIAGGNLAVSNGLYVPVEPVSDHAWTQLVAQVVTAGALVALLVHSLHQTLALLRKNQAQRLAEERDRQHLELQLLKSTKAEALGRLAGGVAHDFNNYLAVILMNTSMLKHADLPARGLSLVDEIEEATLKASAVTKQLLAFGRKQHGTSRQIDLRDVIRGAERMALRLLGERIDLVLDLPEEPVFVHADPVGVEQCVVNLVVNGHDAMPMGGELRISVTTRELHEGDVPPLEAGSWVVLEVSDTGTGMTPFQTEHAFDPFYTTKEDVGGTGLGLSIVAMVMSGVGGTARVASSEAGGTTFELFFPSPEEVVEPETAVPTTTATERGKGELILLVDDDAMVRRSAKRILLGAGYRVVDAEDREGALAHLTRGEEPVLLLTDVVLRNGTGPALADAFLEQLPDRPVLFMSGYTGRVLEHYGLSRSEIHLIEKPFAPADLIARVAAVLTEVTRKSS